MALDKILENSCTRCLEAFGGKENGGKSFSNIMIGNYCLCLNCGHLMIYDKEYLVRDLTPGETIFIQNSKGWHYTKQLMERYRQLFMIRGRSG